MSCRAQTGSNSSRPTIRRNGPDTSLKLNLGSGEDVPSFSFNPLDYYPKLKLRARDEWEALSVAAKQRVAQGFGAPAAEPDLGPVRDSGSQLIPVRQLIEPQIPKAGDSDLRARLWPLVTDPDPYIEAIADEIRNEIVLRWAAQNETLLERDVWVHLVQPREAAQSTVSPVVMLRLGPLLALDFDIEGHSVPSTDGTLALLELDILGSNNLEIIVGEVQADASVIAQGGDLLRASRQLLDSEVDWWAKARQDWDTVSKAEVQAHYRLFSVQMSEEGGVQVPLGMSLPFFLRDHPEYAAELSEVASRIHELSGWVEDDYTDYLDYFDALVTSGELITAREATDETWDRASEMMDEGTAEGVLGYTMAGLTSALYHIGNTFTGGYADTRHQGVQSFKRGDISMDQLDELSDAAALRGVAVGAVMAALTLATAGLAGPVLGTAASFGQKVLFYGAANFATTLGGELTGTGISAAHDFEDPTLQGIWKQGVHSPEQILLNSAIGGGLGALGVPVGIAFGKLVSVVRGAFRAAPAAEGGVGALVGPLDEALATTRPSPLVTPKINVPNWQMEEVAEGVIRFTRSDFPGEVIMSGGTIRLQVPSGSGMLVVSEVPIAEGAAPLAGTELAASRGLVLPPAETSAAVAAQGAPQLAEQNLIGTGRLLMIEGGDAPAATAAVAGPTQRVLTGAPPRLALTEGTPAPAAEPRAIRLPPGSRSPLPGEAPAYSLPLGARGTGGVILMNRGLQMPDFGHPGIAFDPALRRLWRQAMQEARSTGQSNAFTRYETAMNQGQTMTNEELRAAFDTVQSRFLRLARAEGHDIATVHHWNFALQDYPAHITDPFNLFPVYEESLLNRGYHPVHQGGLHRLMTSDPANITRGPVAPIHEAQLNLDFPGMPPGWHPPMEVPPWFLDD